MAVRVGKNNNPLFGCALAALAAGMAGTGPAWAQEGGSSSPSLMGGTEVQDIIVTAQRRAQSLTEVPISVQAFDTSALERSAFTTTNDLVKLAPSVNFTQGGSPTSSSIAIRGIQSVTQENGVQPSTAVIVDDVARGRQNEFVSDFGDIDHIEILRGPQGTLFGKNATGGVINIVTKKPVDSFEGTIEGGYTTDNEKMLRGMVNVPLGDSIRVRLNSYWRDQAPILDNRSPFVVGREFNRTGAAESYGVAGKVAIDLSDNVDLLLSGDISRTKSSMGSIVVLVPDTNPALRAIQLSTGVVADRDHPFINSNSGSFSDQKFWGVAADLTAHLSDRLTVKSITAYREAKNDYFSDSDGGPWGAVRGLGILNNPLNYPIMYVMLNSGGVPRGPNKIRYLSQEIRANYSYENLDIVFGGYMQFFHEYSRVQVPRLVNNTYNNTDAVGLIDNNIYSAFADATYEINPTVSVFGGIRYSHETLELDYSRISWAGAPFNPISITPTVPGTVTAFTTSKPRDNISGRAGVRFEPTDGHSYYASYSRGYKGAAADTSRSVAPGPRAILKPEIADAFEVGTKHRFFDRRLELNVAAFYQKVKDAQQSAIDPAGLAVGAVATRLVNAGTIRSYGVEAEAIARPVKGFRLDGSLSYAHAEFRDFVNSCYPAQTVALGCVGGIQNMEGNRAPGSPRFSANIAATVEFNLPDLPFDSFVRVSYTHTGSIQYGLQNDPLLREPSRGSLDATLGLVGRENKWQVLLYGRNLTNDVFYSALSAADNVIGRVFGFYTRDIKRYGGVQVKFSF